MIQLSVQQANTAGAGLSPLPRPMMPVACGSPRALVPGATRPVAQAVEERKDAELFGWTRIVPRPHPTLAAWSVACGHTLHAWFRSASGKRDVMIVGSDQFSTRFVIYHHVV